MKSSTKKWLLFGTIGVLVLIVVVTPKGSLKPKALAQPPAKVLTKGEYMRPAQTNSAPSQNGPVEIYSKVRVSQ